MGVTKTAKDTLSPPDVWADRDYVYLRSEDGLVYRRMTPENAIEIGRRLSKAEVMP